MNRQSRGHTRAWGLSLWLGSLEVCEAPSSTVFAETKLRNELSFLCGFTREKDMHSLGSLCSHQIPSKICL